MLRRRNAKKEIDAPENRSRVRRNKTKKEVAESRRRYVD